MRTEDRRWRMAQNAILHRFSPPLSSIIHPRFAQLDESAPRCYYPRPSNPRVSKDTNDHGLQVQAQQGRQEALSRDVQGQAQARALADVAPAVGPHRQEE